MASVPRNFKGEGWGKRNLLVLNYRKSVLGGDYKEWVFFRRSGRPLDIGSIR